MSSITYNIALTAPTIGKFMESQAFGRILAGPVGSGKTTGCILDLFMKARQQAPADDGLRYTRFAVVCQKPDQLTKTLKDCETILATPGFGKWSASKNAFRLDFDDVRSEWFLFSLADPVDRLRLIFMELTGAWFSDAIRMNLGIIALVEEQIGQYPSGLRGSCTWKGIIADTNMPTETTLWHQFMEQVRRGEVEGWQLFKQPSALSKEAENLSHLEQTEESKKLSEEHPIRKALGREYYARLVGMRGDDWVERYVKAEYGAAA